MAAHVPRRVFSTPFIVTVAAAASAAATAACEHTYDNPPPPLRVPESSAAAPDASVAAPVSASATPQASASATSATQPDKSASSPPQQAASGASSAAGETSWTLTRDEKTNACVTKRDVDCVMTKDALGSDVRKCNQAPPLPYACPAKVFTFPAWVRREKGETKCTAAWEPTSACNQGQGPTISVSTCNPPPTQYVDVPCPK
jgi:hypothetical protein